MTFILCEVKKKNNLIIGDFEGKMYSEKYFFQTFNRQKRIFFLKSNSSYIKKNFVYLFKLIRVKNIKNTICMKRLIILTILLVSFSQLFAQNQIDTIEVKKALLTVFKQNNKVLTPRQLLKITQINQEAYKEMKMAESNFDAVVVCGFIGGFMVVYPLGTAIASGDANWTLAGIGLGLIAASVPFSVAYSKHAKNGVRIYNNGLLKTESKKIDFNLGLTSNGIGIRITF